MPGLIRGEMIAPGATVIDVGTNYVDGKLVGDVAYDEVAAIAGEITPVPGGVGPVTNAALMMNVLTAAERA
jgi:methylenetetrahydrofolate dehydrogenase (NADP+)/methenyltetrahydrofolate cyclohydrolase